MCDPKITYFDSKVGPVLIEGMDYHAFKFSTGQSMIKSHLVTMVILVAANKVIKNVVMVTPHVQIIGKEAACVTYIRVMQILDM